jgi:predicted transcriptional regulator
MGLEGHDREASMGSAKEEVRRILEIIPDNASFEDIQYHIYVREKIERGLADVKNGKLLSQEEVEQRMRKWTGE